MPSIKCLQILVKFQRMILYFYINTSIEECYISYMMRKKISGALIEYFLSKGPKSAAQRVGRINPLVKVDSQALPSQQNYINSFLAEIGCQQLESKEFCLMEIQSKHTLQNDIKKYTKKKETKKQEKTKSIQYELVFYIKLLLEDKSSPTLFLETLELFQKMKDSQARSLKKYLLYLYKWTINQNGRIPNITKELNQELKNTVIGKIHQAYQDQPDYDAVQQEILRIQTLGKARESIAKGQFLKAMTNYQAIFQDNKNDAYSRMEALQYLCQQSAEKGDENYLLKIVHKIEGDTKEQHHRRYILNAIQKINKNVAESEKS